MKKFRPALIPVAIVCWSIFSLAAAFASDLINTYHALCLPEGATPAQPLAARFINFLVSEEGQNIIRSYGAQAYGEGLYNDAIYARQYEH